ncbi:MAG: hypothetical protein OSB33_05830 [Candidatus Poseidoniales archaeon]|nr:hypothetical protein [Candidatus Poseidoniales archaeon]
MSTLKVDQSGEIGHVHHPQRQFLLDFMNHIKSNGYLLFSYPMPDQERGSGWMMFLYERIPEDVVNSFEA